MNRLKIIFVILSGILLTAVTRWSYYGNMDVTTELYESVYFTRLSVEASRSTRQIEYGLENGKNLNNFYNIQSLLAETKRISSYIDGAYIISADYELLYSSDDSETAVPTRVIPIATDNSSFTFLEDSDRYIVAVPIYGKTEMPEGYMVLSVKNKAIENQIEKFSRENLIQSIAVSTLLWLSCICVFIHWKRLRGRKRFYTSSAIALTGIVSGSVLLNGAAEVIRLQFRIDGIIQQSVSRITDALQNDLTSVSEKGADLSKIYDLNSWLLESCRNIPFIDNLIYDKNYKITAFVSESYIGGQLFLLVRNVLFMTGICVAAGGIVIAVCIFIENYLQRKEVGNGK